MSKILFPAVAGVYNGLAWNTNALDEASSGFLTLTITSTSKGTFSGRLFALDGGSYPFTGLFDTNGDAQAVVKRAGKTPVTLLPHLHLHPPDNLITGAVSNAGWTATLLADRAVFSRANPAVNYAGRFTLALPPGPLAPTNEPGGWGYALLTNSPAGGVLLSGALADASPLSQNVPVAGDGSIPIYQSLLQPKGLAARLADGDQQSAANSGAAP